VVSQTVGCVVAVIVWSLVSQTVGCAVAVIVTVAVFQTAKDADLRVVIPVDEPAGVKVMHQDGQCHIIF